MPTHIHAVLWPEENAKLSNIVRDFKRFTSRALSREIKQRNEQHYLRIFSKARQNNRAQDVSKYQVWQEGYHPEAIFTSKFAREKINYIHNNPVKAGFVSQPEDWEYSSARKYLRGEETYPPTDILFLL